MWGQKVIIINHKGGMYTTDDRQYLLATDKYIYQIAKTVQSQTPIVIESANQIFENLDFTN
jgi:hypothetical protein